MRWLILLVVSIAYLLSVGVMWFVTIVQLEVLPQVNEQILGSAAITNSDAGWWAFGAMVLMVLGAVLLMLIHDETND